MTGSPFSWLVYRQNATKQAEPFFTTLNNLFTQGTQTSISIKLEWWYRAAYPLQNRQKAADFATTANTPSMDSFDAAAETPIVTGTIGPTRTCVSSTSSTSLQPPVDKDLSTGSMTAIAVTLGLVAVTAIVVMLWWRWCRTHHARKHADAEPEAPSGRRATPATGRTMASQS